MVFSVLICLLDCCLGMLAVGFVFDFLSGLRGLMVLSGILMLVFVFTIHLGIAVGFGVFGCGSSGGRCDCVCGCDLVCCGFGFRWLFVLGGLLVCLGCVVRRFRFLVGCLAQVSCFALWVLCADVGGVAYLL